MLGFSSRGDESRPITTIATFVLWSLIVISIASPLYAAPSDVSASSTDNNNQLNVSGYLSTRYVFRSAETSTPTELTFRDQDLFGELRIDVAAPERGKYEFHFFGTVRGDLDDNQNIHTFDPLEDIGNATPKRYTGVLYEAHLDLNSLLPKVTQIRLGRQAGTRDEAIYFDGIAADIRMTGSLNFTVYGGAAVHFYEIDWKEGSDGLAGAGIDYTPAASTGISLDYLTLKDSRDYLLLTDEKNNLLSLRLWQRFGDSLKASAKVRYQDSDWRDMNLRILGSFSEARAEFGAAYFRQFKTQLAQANEISPFVDVLGPSYPYQTIDLKVRKLLGSRYAVDIGYYQRAVLDSADIGTFNRDFGRLSGAVSAEDVIWRGLALTISGDRWSSESNDYYSTGADITYRYAKSGTISAGTYYSLYKYGDLFFPREMDRVRTYYLSTKVPIARLVVMDLAYELEKGIDVYHVMRAGLRYDF